MADFSKAKDEEPSDWPLFASFVVLNRFEFCGKGTQKIAVAFFSIGGKFGALFSDFLRIHSLLRCAVLGGIHALVAYQFSESHYEDTNNHDDEHDCHADEDFVDLVGSLGKQIVFA